MIEDERLFLACAYDSPENIDKAVAAGLTRQHFTDYAASAQWQLLVDLRTRNAPSDPASVYSAAVAGGSLDQCGGLAGITACSTVENIALLNGPALLSVLLNRYARREAWRLATRAREMVEGDGCDLSEVSDLAANMVEVCAGKVVSHRSVADIAKEAELDAQADITGTADRGVIVTTGLTRFDQISTGMRSHEYVVVAGRSSHGKSSLMLQIAGHNLARDLRVAIFSLETSDKSVVKQLAAQRAQIDLRNIAGALKEWQDRYLKGLAYLRDTKNLLVYDRELSIDAIGSRCRMLAQSFKPHLVVLDYMGLIAGSDGTAYERVSKISKAMIPLQKTLGCTLMVGCQLNQGAEKEDREPTRTDFRDSGQILEDCHRAIAVWRKPGQMLDQIVYDYDILQLKLRDGPLAKIGCKFNAPFTRFYEDN